MDLGVVNDGTDQSRSTVRFFGDYVCRPKELIGYLNTSYSPIPTDSCRSVVLLVNKIPVVHSRGRRLHRDFGPGSFLEKDGDIIYLDADLQPRLGCG